MRRRKIRADAVLRGLDDSQKKAVFEFAESHSLEKTAQWLKDEFDLANPETGDPLDHSTVSRWLKAEREDAGMIELLGQIADDAERAEAVGEAIGKGNQLTEAATKMLAGAAFRFLRENPEKPDPLQLELFAKTILKIRGQDLDAESGRTKAAHLERTLAQKDRDFALQREKFIVTSCEKIMQAARDPKMREVVDDSKLTNAEKIAAIRHAYFADIDALEVVLPE
ncbi:MAG TPA: hypothetical protein VF614_02260 [Chthoniobacteraceae bacterium]|jgi:hypothetical protein